jgi:hypothetical protein
LDEKEETLKFYVELVPKTIKTLFHVLMGELDKIETIGNELTL